MQFLTHLKKHELIKPKLQFLAYLKQHELMKSKLQFLVQIKQYKHLFFLQTKSKKKSKNVSRIKISRGTRTKR